MDFGQSMKIAKRTLVDGATLDELRDAARNLRALTPDSALAELVEARIAEIETDGTVPSLDEEGA
ncbi:hypothetical protein [Microvirga antarctica]|uniref:hypothetical protein n=1 Tax=Microvirga antarctica TaxID=2819233 RepID=UPI001B3138E1|nr:hypothetical protein [Microvirga antarctica]